VQRKEDQDNVPKQIINLTLPAGQQSFQNKALFDMGKVTKE
tara:strand:+ start:1031 stop:1153 length:123 start_codon:yes stop_codon:yes gene_type:complete